MNISEDFFCIELKLCTVVTVVTKFHDMSTVTGALHSKGKLRVFLLREVLFAPVVHSVGVSKYGHHKSQAQESSLDSGRHHNHHQNV